MAKDPKDGGYVERVRDNTRRYIEELMQENERLRALAVTVQTGYETMKSQLESLRTDLELRQNEQVRLKAALDSIEQENQRFSRQYLEVERQNTALATLYAASYGLHGTVERTEVLQAIKEIVINLVGSEEVGIFGMRKHSGVLLLLESMGIDEDALRVVPLDDGPIGKVGTSGELYLRADDDEPAQRGQLTACIPLRAAGQVVGVIAIFRLLPHKPGLGPLDRELFSLLGTHAATALYCAELHAAHGEHPAK
jgi:hypothetical protein